jgi:UDP-glucose 4-epimerase
MHGRPPGTGHYEVAMREDEGMVVMAAKEGSGKGRHGNDAGWRARASGALIRGVLGIPGLNRVHPWLREDKTDARWLPINADIQIPGDAPMPLMLLERFIEEASHRVIIDYCGCRKGWHCEDYPVEIGCLMMGESALEIKKFPGREVGAEEARGHARRAVEAGLVPIVGKVRADNYIFDVKDRSRMLTVCFCCECCCVTRFTRYVPLKRLEPLQPRLEGISMQVTESCTGCGKCARHCYIQAIQVVDKKVVIGDYCRACGRCAGACPEGAIEMRIDDPDFLDKTYDRIRSYVKYD